MTFCSSCIVNSAEAAFDGPSLGFTTGVPSTPCWVVAGSVATAAVVTWEDSGTGATEGMPRSNAGIPACRDEADEAPRMGEHNDMIGVRSAEASSERHAIAAGARWVLVAGQGRARRCKATSTSFMTETTQTRCYMSLIGIPGVLHRLRPLIPSNQLYKFLLPYGELQHALVNRWTGLIRATKG
jgi:hypothetical protein